MKTTETMRELFQRFEQRPELGHSAEEVSFLFRRDVDEEITRLVARGWLYRSTRTFGFYHVGSVVGTTPLGRGALRQRGWTPSEP